MLKCKLKKEDHDNAKTFQLRDYQYSFQHGLLNLGATAYLPLRPGQGAKKGQDKTYINIANGNKSILVVNPVFQQDLLR